MPVMLSRWSKNDVLTFVRALGGSGERQTCPPGCPVVKLFTEAADAFTDVDGRVLRDVLLEHEGRVRGLTNESTAIARFHLVPQPGTPLHMQFMTRLRDAVRSSLALEPPNRTDWLRE
jgi:hypothetical protein